MFVSGAGSTFVRWGRKTCPGNGTEMVYWGTYSLLPKQNIEQISQMTYA